MGRVQHPDGPDRLFHVTARVNWRAFHLDDDRAKRLLARLLAENAERFCVAVWAWVLMDNHFHSVVQSPPARTYRQLTGRRTVNRHFRPWPAGHENSTVVGQFMRELRRTASVLRQTELELSGRFWEGAYDARRIESAADLAVRIAYDHRNPLKAGLVSECEAYEWSSASWWTAGDEGLVPLRLPTPLPFDLNVDSLREDIQRLQKSESFWRCEEEISKVLKRRGRKSAAADLEDLLARCGITLQCASAGAHR